MPSALAISTWDCPSRVLRKISLCLEFNFKGCHLLPTEEPPFFFGNLGGEIGIPSLRLYYRKILDKGVGIWGELGINFKMSEYSKIGYSI
jgi:hypothetical protein